MNITGTIFEIRRFAIHDGPGIRTTVFFKGCPLNCAWCHNPEGRCNEVEDFPVRPRDGAPINGELPRTRVGSAVTVAAVMTEVMKDEVFYDQSGGGVTCSGGEPMAQVAFLEALLQAAKEAGLHTAIDTCGYAPWRDFERIIPWADLFLFDVKLMDEGAHLKYTGVSNDLILSNLTALAARGNNVIVRVPLVPGITDTANNLEAIAAFLKPLPSLQRISLLPYNKLGEDKIDRYQLSRRRLALEPQSSADLEEHAAKFRADGFAVKIGG